ncbi:DUF5012 domain-containing protein [bacterium]|nr:DUF5012 domain-containing protein [Bacteroidales bacterium]MBO7434551.1 DUF5012 domain-containing protein [bacterium]
MKKYAYILLFSLMAAFAVSCEKTSEGTTQVISYFQMYGASTMYLGVGDEFVDPGYQELEGGGHVVTTILDMNGEEVDAVSTEDPGFFTITYSTVNDQGLYFEKSRMVYIYDASVTEELGTFVVDGEASFYYNNGKTFAANAESYAASGRTTDPNPTIVFKQVVGNIYSANDLLGGWYTWIQGRGPLYEANYGSAYLTYFDMTGFVTLNADMTLTLMSSNIRAWGDGLDLIANSVYDPETKRLSYDWRYAGTVAAHVEMVKK